MPEGHRKSPNVHYSHYQCLFVLLVPGEGAQRADEGYIYLCNLPPIHCKTIPIFVTLSLSRRELVSREMPKGQRKSPNVHYSHYQYLFVLLLPGEGAQRAADRKRV